MSDGSQIEWTATVDPATGTRTPGASWPITTGCTKVSPGCDRCYAINDGWRMSHNPNIKVAGPYRGVVQKTLAGNLEWSGKVRCLPERLDWPTSRWGARPRRIFVCSQSDLLHKDVPDDFIVEAFRVMAQASQHTYLVLTKRPSRLVNTSLQARIEEAIGPWPRHIQYGVTIESQEYAWRLLYQRRCHAPIHFISAEPLLSPMVLDLSSTHWIIIGCESGKGARPMAEEWVRGLVAQGQIAGTKIFYKQQLDEKGKKVRLPLIDGRQWAEYPE